MIDTCEIVPEDIFEGCASSYEFAVKKIVGSIISILNRLFLYHQPCEPGVCWKDLSAEICLFVASIKEDMKLFSKEDIVLELIEEKDDNFIQYSVDNMIKRSLILFHKAGKEKAKVNGNIPIEVQKCIILCYDALLFLSNGLLLSVIPFPDMVGNVLDTPLFKDSIKDLEEKIAILLKK